MSLLSSTMRGALAKGGFAFHLRSVRLYGNSGSLHLTLEPLDKENEGIFQMTLTRPEAKNAIGELIRGSMQRNTCLCPTPTTDTVALIQIDSLSVVSYTVNVKFREYLNAPSIKQWSLCCRKTTVARTLGGN